MAIDLSVLDAVNQCQISELEKAGKTLDPSREGSCAQFSNHVRNVQAVIVHTYQVISYAAVREPDPSVAAELWKGMAGLCNSALIALKEVKDKYPLCGTSELYDLALDYKLASDKRFLQNQEDSECARVPIPGGLFETTS